MYDSVSGNWRMRGRGRIVEAQDSDCCYVEKVMMGPWHLSLVNVQCNLSPQKQILLYTTPLVSNALVSLIWLTSHRINTHYVYYREYMWRDHVGDLCNFCACWCRHKTNKQMKNKSKNKQTKATPLETIYQIPFESIFSKPVTCFLLLWLCILQSRSYKL